MKPIWIACGLFLIAFIALRHAAPGGILLYQGIALGGVISIAQFGVQKLMGAQTFTVVAKDALLSFLLIYAFVFTVPTTVDRAYSVKMIMHLAVAPDGANRAAIADDYIADFVRGGGLHKRLTEQSASGVLREEGGIYKLTATGRLLDKAFRTTQWIFRCGEHA